MQDKETRERLSGEREGDEERQGARDRRKECQPARGGGRKRGEGGSEEEGHDGTPDMTVRHPEALFILIARHKTTKLRKMNEPTAESCRVPIPAPDSGYDATKDEPNSTPPQDPKGTVQRGSLTRLIRCFWGDVREDVVVLCRLVRGQGSSGAGFKHVLLQQRENGPVQFMDMLTLIINPLESHLAEKSPSSFPSIFLPPSFLSSTSLSSSLLP